MATTLRFAGKVALVTGAGSGIGRAAALGFAREGAKVAVFDRDAEGLAETAGLITGLGAEVLSLRGDVSREDDVAEAVERTVAAFGSLDCAFNNAGVSGGFRPLEHWDLADFRRVTDVNLTGVFLCLKYQLPVMAKQGGGAVVNNASVAGLRGAAWLAPYVSSKHAVVGLTRVAAMEYGSKNVRVNVVCPGWTDTPLIRTIRDDPESLTRALQRTPLGRLGRPEEVAEAVLWLCSDAASFADGQPFIIDGGLTA